jgi:hypothetical protein
MILERSQILALGSRALESTGTLSKSIRSRGSDRPGSSHNHVANGTSSLAEIFRLKELEPMWQQPLLD